MSLMNLSIAGLVFFLSSWLSGYLSSSASRVRWLDYPNGRSLHTAPTPRTGGLAILGSLMMGLLLEAFRVLLVSTQWGMPSSTSLWVVGMVTLIAVISLWDDWAKLPSGLRLGVHGLITVGVVSGAGLTIDFMTIPLLGSFELGWMAIPLTFLFLMWMTNLYNFMDGMDGFAGGMAVIGFGFLSYLAWTGGSSFIALISLLTVGAAGGFLLHNKPPAKIFMGDVGSILLGFLAGTLSVMGIHYRLYDIWVPILIFSPFTVDATVTLFRRLLRGEKVWQAHLEHYYQRLVLMGWSHRKTTLVEYCLMLACGTSAVVYSRVSEDVRLGLLLMWVLIYIELVLAVSLAERRSKKRKMAAALSTSMRERASLINEQPNADDTKQPPPPMSLC